MADQDTTQLYRHFDKAGRLLYVGVSLSALNRLGQHQDHSHWFSSIKRVEVEQFPTRAAALSAETAAIAKENPLHNIAQKKAPKPLSKFEQAEIARQRLYARTVNFKPLYSVSEAAQALGMTPSTVKKKIISGELGAIEMGRHTQKRSDGDRLQVHHMISGWQIIDYIEHLQKTAGTK